MVMFLAMCVRVFVCLFGLLTFKSLILETSFLVCKYIFRIFRSGLYIKVIGSRSREQKVGLCVMFVGGMKGSFVALRFC